MNLSPDFSERKKIKEEKPSLEALIETQLENKENLEANARNFFALDKDTHLTEEELQQFKIFAKHATKRIIRGQSRKYKGRYEDSYISITLLKLHKDDPHLIHMILHDVSHSAGLVLQGSAASTKDSLVPLFFRHPVKDDFNKREIMEEELWAFLFFSINLGYGNMGNYTKDTLKKSSSFEEFKNLYIQDCLSVVEKSNQGLIYKGDLTQEEFNHRYTSKQEAEAILESIKENPSETFLSILQYIWGNQNNPRVLANVFFKGTGSYIEQLKKRKVYDLEEK